ncbi:MAG: hypothetical protein JNM03_09550 [Sphingopyxis sp.]|uniref:hypothetical protein n=1 Tax=Sphingopyxis sp. TaxID=1908224 RepID=UPI001A3B60CA|nr:hypothetical protein [Sphingopyxis sp.]MBL9070222.1 hypothetical protein [Sphingopyxis sp.]
MTRVEYITVTLDRVDAQGRPFQSLIHIGPDGWSQSGDDLGDTRDIAEAIFEACADELDAESEDCTA